MRTRRSAKDSEADPILGDLLQNLHQNHDRDVQLSEGVDERPSAPKTLGDVSKQSVGKLLDRVGVRRAAAKKRQLEQEKPTRQKRLKGRGKLYGEDDLLHQRPSISAIAPVCGALAKTSRDAESSYTANFPPTVEEPNESRPQREEPSSRPDAAMPEDLEEASANEDDDEFEWEQGEETFAGTSDDKGSTKEQVWNGDITIQVETKAQKRAAQRKPPARRANARDKEFAELVHKAHILCLLGRGRMVDAACNDPLLQASILSLLPPSISLLCSSGASGTILLRSFVTWFSTSFEVSSSEKKLPPTRVQKDLPSRLLEAAQLQVGSAEEVAAISVAFLRGLGFTTRYVASLDVSPLKPDASSLAASAGWDPQVEVEGIIFSAHQDIEAKRATSLARLLAMSAFQQVSSNGHLSSSSEPQQVGSAVLPARSPQNEGVDDRSKSVEEGCKQDGDDHSHINGPGKKVLQDSTEDVNDNVKAYSRKKRTKLDSRGRFHKESDLEIEAEADVLDQKLGIKPPGRKGDAECETQPGVAMCAKGASSGLKGASTVEPVIPKTPLDMKRLNGTVAQKKKGESTLAKLRNSSRTGSLKGESSTEAVPVNRTGAPLYWAEVYLFEGENERWIHVDAARAWFNGADKVEPAAIAGRVPLRYVVAFAGSGAKDVTRRYVSMWSSVSSLRVDDGWWASTLQPLKQLEAAAIAGATLRYKQSQEALSLKGAREQEAVPEDHSVLISGGPKQLPVKNEHKPEQSKPTVNEVPEVKRGGKRATRTPQSKKTNGSKAGTASGSQSSAPQAVDRSALEDMELETKAYTEPLPTSQQAYKSHHLYALERWLTKYQTLHPKGPVLGCCAGQPVYPRSCVQILHTPDRWLREGLKVREGEIPAKVVKANHLAMKSVKQAANKLDGEEENLPPPTTDLFGKWQCDPWRPPRAVNGIVPKNERGQIDCWSEYCIPPGTVHLRFPRLVPIVKALGIDFAPAMVGFEIRKRRSVPMYEGVVVCEEFKDVIMDAYRQEEEIRFGQLRRKREEVAIRRWRELLHSMATRERLKAAYEGFPLTNAENERHSNTPKKGTDSKHTLGASKKKVPPKQEVAHVHHFPDEDQTYDEDTGTTTKVCACGFTVHVEEM
ncbi:xeroderma pigmentosum group C-complementing protein [Marchantia polymorpha subsp. ruderalis]|uniref:Rad4 beta-hairpin domain-containing protein n=1 Tax=Marchantia polymorpha TaxID=3197 RepID=A0A2R6WP83_MARPO|nr:hypothetical protein MARPO_0069s0010 [Marchantia polymorpha]BBN03456.1 hypothetical protein Mp_2g23610 [Marchantia polymorpha subsp. ruderalis]|eukprot:PTQ35661.1 hypothetical protein MARPO_0069s0010 [Marchantia polymorpha]